MNPDTLEQLGVQTQTGVRIYSEPQPSPDSEQSDSISVWRTFGADKAPADVDMTVVAVTLLSVEVVGADDGSVGDHLASCSHTQVTHVVRDRAAQAAHQPPCSRDADAPGQTHTIHRGKEVNNA